MHRPRPVDGRTKAPAPRDRGPPAGWHAGADLGDARPATRTFADRSKSPDNNTHTLKNIILAGATNFKGATKPAGMVPALTKSYGLRQGRRLDFPGNRCPRRLESTGRRRGLRNPGPRSPGVRKVRVFPESGRSGGESAAWRPMCPGEVDERTRGRGRRRGRKWPGRLRAGRGPSDRAPGPVRNPARGIGPRPRRPSEGRSRPRPRAAAGRAPRANSGRLAGKPVRPRPSRGFG